MADGVHRPVGMPARIGAITVIHVFGTAGPGVEPFSPISTCPTLLFGASIRRRRAYQDIDSIEFRRGGSRNDARQHLYQFSEYVVGKHLDVLGGWWPDHDRDRNGIQGRGVPASGNLQAEIGDDQRARQGTCRRARPAIRLHARSGIRGRELVFDPARWGGRAPFLRRTCDRVVAPLPLRRRRNELSDQEHGELADRLREFRPASGRDRRRPACHARGDRRRRDGDRSDRGPGRRNVIACRVRVDRVGRC